jgi:hypothetical protein
MILILAIAVVGSAAATALLWPWIGPLAVVAAPFGGSLLAVMIFGYLAWHGRKTDLAHFDALISAMR